MYFFKTNFPKPQLLNFPNFRPEENNKKNDVNMETLQPTKQNDMIANNNNYKVSKNKRTTDEDKNKQIRS